MASESLVVARMTDAEVLDAFKKVEKVATESGLKLSVKLFGGGTAELDLASDSSSQEFAKLEDSNSFVISSATLRLKKITINYTRGGLGQTKSAFVDNFSINQTDRQPALSASESIDIFSALLSSVRVAMDSIEESPGGSESVAAHLSVLSRLESLNETLVRDTSRHRLALENDFAGSSAALREEVSEERKELQREHKERLEQLAEKERELEAEKAKLDDSTNTFARRQIRRDLIEEIKARQANFSLTGDTRNKRISIVVAMAVLFVFFLGLTIWASLQITGALDSGSVLIISVAFARQLLFSIGAVATALYFIRWQDRWAEQHATAEFNVKQFELDIERASWIVESGLEWRKDGSDMPSELVKTLSAGLFDQSKETIEQLKHPADQLASALMGTASTIRLKAGDSELVLNPKELKKVNMESDSPDKSG